MVFATLFQKWYICRAIAIMLRGFWTMVFVLLSQLVIGQTYSGYVYNAEKEGEGIPRAKVYFVDLGKTIITDENGRWEIQDVPSGVNHVEVSYIGFETIHKDIELVEGVEVVIKLEVAHRNLDKVIVSNDGYLHRESITNIESHSISSLTRIPGTTVGQALTNIPGVYNTSIGVGVSKPVIRGLSGSSVVTYVNGLRIQNQQWGSDHGMPITSVGIGNVEVIKGPASLLFGADALGGVLYFVDEPYVEKNTISGFVSSRFESNSLGSVNRAGIKYSKGNLRFNAYGGFDSFADYQIPNGMKVLNSRFYEASGKFSLGYSKKNWVFDLRYNFYKGRTGLPGHTHDSIPDFDSFLTTNQNRRENVPAIVTHNNFVSIENKFFFNNHELFVTLGNTNNNLKEHEEKYFFPDYNMNLNNTLYNVKFRSRWGRRWESTIGAQGMYQMNRNGDAPFTLIPDANYMDNGVFGLIRYRTDLWSVLGGVRFDQRVIDAGDFIENAKYNGFNYSLGFARVSDKTSIRVNASSGFRAPNTSELLSDGVHHGSQRYEIGDVNIGTESAVQIDASFGLHFDDLEIILNPFYNRISDYIYIERTDSIIEGYQVFEYTQTDLAQLYGVDFGFHYHPHFAHWIHIESSLSNVFAEDGNKNPLPLIPQTRINSNISFNFEPATKFKTIEFVLQYKYFFEQNRLGVFEEETGDFHLLDMGINTELDLKNPIMLSLGVRNFMNVEYADHLSALRYLDILNPGRNFYFSIRYQFSKQLKSQ